MNVVRGRYQLLETSRTILRRLDTHAHASSRARQQVRYEPCARRPESELIDAERGLCMCINGQNLLRPRNSHSVKLPLLPLSKSSKPGADLSPPGRALELANLLRPTCLPSGPRTYANRRGYAREVHEAARERAPARRERCESARSSQKLM